MNTYDIFPSDAPKTTIRADRFRRSNARIMLFRGEDDLVAEFPSAAFGIAENGSVVA